jgi:hypothetical protein
MGGLLLWLELRMSYAALNWVMEHDKYISMTEMYQRLVVVRRNPFWMSFGEEIIFRWLTFYAIFAVLNWTQALLKGPLLQLHEHILLPMIDFFTSGSLHPLFVNSWGWMAGIAFTIVAFCRFNNHYNTLMLGRLRIIHLPVGFLLTWIMLQYGLSCSYIANMLYWLLESFIVIHGFRGWIVKYMSEHI